jgi:hypothetical protein
MYYKGEILTRTQDTARNIVEDISRNIQLNGGDVTTPSIVSGSRALTSQEEGADPANPSVGQATVQVQCIGNQRYVWTEKMRVNRSVSQVFGQVRNALVRDSINGPTDCDSTSATIPDITSNLTGSKIESLLSDNMRLTAFEVNRTGDNIYSIRIGVAYASDSDLLNYTGTVDNPAECRVQPSSSQWCATAYYSTQVLKRIN